MENTNHFGYFAKSVASDLGTPSSLRRWSIDLEKAGYIIERNEKDQRIYYERDFKAFRELKKFLSHSIPYADVIKAVVATDWAEQNAVQTPSVYKPELRLTRDELEKIIHSAVKKAVEEDREVMFQTFEQKKSNSIEMRDRQLPLARKNTLEEKQKEISASLEKTEKRKWWSKLFSK
ncbi:MerR family transcriptional regulator [Peribacillus sp. NPDC006672]|uniref:MerR family transcriptional regulator n=1 Tax=Peribacillus sp. NPDC006672 TaxID=3390606 RepID=UPI003D08C7FF